MTESTYSTVKKWAAECRRGRESVEDYKQSRRLKEATTDEAVDLVNSLSMSLCDRRRSLRDIAGQICIYLGASLVYLDRYLRYVQGLC